MGVILVAGGQVRVIPNPAGGELIAVGKRFFSGQRWALTGKITGVRMLASMIGDRRGRTLVRPGSPLGLLILSIILVLTTPFLSPVPAQAFTSPHGGYSGTTSYCETCHAPHEAAGSKLIKSPTESALCFTCHNGTGSNYNTQVQMDQNPAVNAMHPVAVTLPNNNGAYSYTPNTTAGLASPGPYTCSQCHNPHGDSGNGKLLRAAYDTNEYVTYMPSPDPYAACWTCHATGAIVNDVTFFPRHNRHIVELQAPCTACHFSPHGVTNAELVKFNPAMVSVSPSSGLGPSFVDQGFRSGSCTLSCHNADHNKFSY